MVKGHGQNNAVDAAWPDVEVTGVVVTRYGHGVPAGRIRILEAAHPVSDSMSQTAEILLEGLDCLNAMLSLFKESIAIVTKIIFNALALIYFLGHPSDCSVLYLE